MSEKHLTELGWKSLVSKLKIKDPGLGKALAGFGKCAETDVRGRIAALDEIDKQAKILEKEHKKEPEAAGYLDEVLKESAKSRKPLELQIKSAGKDKGKEEEEEDEGEDDETAEFAKDLKAKIIRALAQVKSKAPGELPPGEELTGQLAFAAYVGKSSAVLIGQRIGGGSRKLLPTIAGGSGGTYHTGHCIFEKNAHTFVLEQVPGGLAKKLSKAIFAETGQKYKVRCRSIDGATESDSDTDVDPDEAGTSSTTDVDPHALYEKRLEGILPELQHALQQQLGDTSKLRAVSAFAQEKAAAGNFQSALQALDAMEKLIAAGKGSPSSGGTGPSGFGKVDFEKIHLDWDSGKKKVEAKLSELHSAIIADWDDPTAMTAAGNLQKVLARFNEGLGDTLDALRNAADPATRTQLAGKAQGIADRYLAYLDGNPLVAHVEDNPFDIAVEAKTVLGAPLQELRTQLAKTGP